jgi:plasmid stabilization system protein ParE
VNRAVRLTPEAEQDLVRLADFIGQFSPAAAARARETISAGLRSLQSFAERGRPGQRPDLRELVGKFGSQAYVIQYRIVPDTVLVSRGFHSREERPA